MITVMRDEEPPGGATAAGQTAARADDDAHPVNEVAIGGPADFDAFCRREHAAVVGLGYVLTGSWTAAEDLAQDAFFAAFRRWDTIATYEDRGAWVRRVVANRAVSWRRRLGAEARAMTRLGGRPAGGAAHDEIPERDAEAWALVRRLPARQAQVFALTYVEDLSLEQVGAVLGISAGTAKTHLTRARAALAAAGDPPTDEGAPR